MNISVIILADNLTPLKNSEKVKCMTEVLFKPMIDWVISSVRHAGFDNISVIAGKNLQRIKTHFKNTPINVYEQITDLSTIGIIVFLNGDKPFIDADSIKHAIEMHIRNGNEKTIISDESIGYCINSDSIGKTDPKTSIYNSANENIRLTADTYSDLNRINETMRLLILGNLMNNGVDIPCTDGIIIGPDCKIGNETKILPNTIICGDVTIGKECIIGPNSYIENAQIGDNVKFNNSQIRNAEIQNNADIGPFVQIRPGSVIGDSVHLGNFVEVKNSAIDSGTKVSHLTYVGDSDVGRNVNFGCGTVTVNFNGKTKNRTIIKDNAFIGCNTNLVAPVTIGKNSYTAAGSTITQDVPDNTLAVARERQINKDGWVKKNQPYRNKI